MLWLLWWPIGGRHVFYSLFLLHVHVHVQRPPSIVVRASSSADIMYNAPACYSSTTRHSAMVPTVTRLSAQPAIVKIRRVDALILIRVATTTTTTTCLYAFTALLLLLVEGADKYTAIAPSSP